MRTLRFDRFELKPLERRLLDNGVAVPLGARAFDLLLALLARPGQLVTKAQLLDEVWPGLVVEEANLSVQMSALRKVLGGELISTIPGRGYRFAGRVDVVPASTPEPGVPESVEPLAAVTSDGATPAAASTVAAHASRPAPVSTGPTLIGRDAELVSVSSALAAAGCVTLVGPAGVGKTSLARALAAGRPHGAAWVDLAPLTAGDQVLPAVARALAVTAAGADLIPQLCATLGSRLLVLDNGEHLVDAVATLVSQLLQCDPTVTVLATSQLRLAVTGEQVYRLEPLALPLDSDALDLHRGAVALFIERARAADHRFVATPAQLPLLREICRRLDGLPLALEMAAARVPALGLAGLAQALERRFALLTGGWRDAAARHRTLQAALNWSHDLLSPDDQRLYRLCGVFSGGFTLDLLLEVAASDSTTTQVTAAPTMDASRADAAERRWAVIDSLSQLVDRSLVDVGEGDPPRYRLLETMREDARQRLLAHGEDDAARAQLLRALADYARQYLDPVTASAAWRERLSSEHDNLRESIAWGQTKAPSTSHADTVAIAVATAQIATFAAWRLEAMRWLDAVEPLTEGREIPAPLRAHWWIERARQWLMSRHHDARAMAERALALSREVGDDDVEFRALSNLVRAPGGPDDELPALCQRMSVLLARNTNWGPFRAHVLAGAEATVCDRLGDGEGVLRCRLRELALARELGNEAAATAAETNIVFALHQLDRHEDALARARELTARLGDDESGNAAYAWIGLMVALQALGHAAEFRAALPRAARVLRVHDLPLLAPTCARLLAAEGRAVDALRILGHARARFAARGMPMTASEAAALAAFEGHARATHGDATVDLCLTEGASLDEAAVETMVLRSPSGPPTESPADRAATQPTNTSAVTAPSADG